MSPSIVTSRDRKSIRAPAEKLDVTEREAARRQRFTELGAEDVARLSEISAHRHDPKTPCHTYGIANRALRSLPQATLERILPALEPVNLVQRQILHRSGGPYVHLYFVNRGLVSFIQTMQDGRTAGIGTTGIESVVNSHALLTSVSNAITDCVVQIPGTALRIGIDIVRHEMAKDDALREMIHKNAGFTIFALAQNAACNRLHSIKERCSRLLLRAHDSARDDRFPLTHEFLAIMLGVQRSGVSITMSYLQKSGFIRYLHGHVTIMNRSGLEEAACECYGTIQDKLENLVGAPNRR